MTITFQPPSSLAPRHITTIVPTSRTCLPRRNQLLQPSPRFTTVPFATAASPTPPPPRAFQPDNYKSTTIPSNLVDVAEQAADAAAAILRSHFRQPLPVDFKADDSPVTTADREAEAAIIAIIKAAFPHHTVIGEETGGSHDPDQPGIVWVIDPLDGTRAFISGRPTFATLISVVVDGFATVGIIDQPISRERWVGRPDGPTTLNGTPVAVRPRAPLSACILQATTPDMFIGLDSLAFRRVARQARNVVYGGDCYAYAMIASGCADLVVEADLKPWDYLALVPIVEGAGGVMSDWFGAHLGLIGDGRVVAASSPALHQETLDKLDALSEIGLTPPDDSDEDKPSDAEAEAVDVFPEDPGPGYVESMTGYGIGYASGSGYLVSVQARSINSRHCEVQIKGAGILIPFETEFIAAAKRIGKRGRIVLNFDIDTDESFKNRKVGVEVDVDAVREVRDILKQISVEAGIDNVTVSDVMRFSEVLTRPESGMIAKDLMPIAKNAVVNALEDMCKARRREGAMLQVDMMKRTRHIQTLVADIEQRAPDRVDVERARLSKLLDSYLDRELAENRVEAEVTLFADKVDFSEEAVRLKAHVRVFEMTFLAVDDPIGSRLLFLLQEMLREANTLAAKANDATISHLAVMIKEEIEKLREQCSNIN